VTSKGIAAMNPHVIALTAETDHRLLLEFATGEKRLFDLTPYLEMGVFRALQDPRDFAKAQVVDGSVEWPGEIDLSYDTLYLRSVALQPAVA
jgi:hypothetical protein